MSEPALAYSPEEAIQPEGAATSSSSLSESPTHVEASSSTSPSFPTAGHSFAASSATAPLIESPTHAAPSSQIGAPSLAASLESSTLHEAPHDASLLELNTHSTTSASTTGGYTDGEGQQSLSPQLHHQHQHQQQHDQQLQDQQLHNLQDLAYDSHLLDFNSHHTFHSHPHAQPTSADVLSLDHQLHQHQQHHHQQHDHDHNHNHHQQHQHQHQQHQQHHHHLHQQHQLDSSGHHHHNHAALASAIAAATSGSLTGGSLAGLAAHFQGGSHQHALPSLPPPLPTFAPMPHHHHDDGSGGGLPAVMADSNSMVSSHSHGGDDSGSGAYAHLQPQQQRQQQQHTQVQLPPAAPLYCLCQQPYDGSCFMLACDHCNKWFHGKCVGITEESARRGEHSTYVCPSCVRSGGVGSLDHGHTGAGDTDIAEGHVGESGAPPDTSSTTDSTSTSTSTTSTGSSTGEKRAREHGSGNEGGDEEAGLGGGEVMVIRDEGMNGSIGGIDGGDGGEPTKKRRKTQMHQRGERLCRFPGCDKKITCRSYCPRHQKQKERCSKRGTLFSTSSSPRRKSVLIGRPSKIFSQTRNQRQKLKRFDEKINEFAGGEQEGTAMLEKYLNSSYGQKRLPSTKGDKMAQHIGQNAIQLINQLPPTSPLRKPLIKALGLGLSQSEVADTFHVSRKTVERSFALPSEENLLFSLVSRPRGMKAKSSADVPTTLDAPLQVQLQQAGLYPPPPSDQSTSEHLEMDLGHSLPPSFTVEENGHISVSVTTRRSGEEEDDDDNEDEDEALVGHGGSASGPGESVQTHVLLQGNVVPVASMMDEVDTAPLVFQGITGE